MRRVYEHQARDAARRLVKGVQLGENETREITIALTGGYGVARCNEATAALDLLLRYFEVKAGDPVPEPPMAGFDAA